MARSAIENSQQEMTIEQFRAHMFAILSQELRLSEVAWLPSRELRFEFEERTYWIVFDERDPKFLTVHGGMFWRIESAEELVTARNAVNDVVKQTKAVKMWLDQQEDQIWVSAAIETFLPTCEVVCKAWVKRQLSALRFATRNFAERMVPGTS